MGTMWKPLPPPFFEPVILYHYGLKVKTEAPDLVGASLR